MTNTEFIESSDRILKLIRTEYGFSQEKMAETLGMSKKTLVQIEKGRSSLGWMGAITLSTVFSASEVLSMTFGGPPTEIIMALTFDSELQTRPKTFGGKVWWTDIEKHKKFKMQRNIISQHYRILDSDNRRVCSSFEKDSIRLRFKELTGNGIKQDGVSDTSWI